MCEESIESIVAFLDNIQLINKAAKSQIIPSFSLLKQKNLLQQVNVELEKQNLNYKRISVHLSTPLSEIYSDPMLIKQILLNLCTNALKFSSGEVNLFLKTTSHEFIIKIQDSGIGIPEEETDLVFNPFHRAANARRIPGYGLGLAIVSSLTDYLGGKIYQSSIVGQGTSFKIIIPCETGLSKTESML